MSAGGTTAVKVVRTIDTGQPSEHRSTATINVGPDVTVLEVLRDSLCDIGRIEEPSDADHGTVVFAPGTSAAWDTPPDPIAIHGTSESPFGDIAPLSIEALCEEGGASVRDAVVSALQGRMGEFAALFADMVSSGYAPSPGDDEEAMTSPVSAGDAEEVVVEAIAVPSELRGPPEPAADADEGVTAPVPIVAEAIAVPSEPVSVPPEPVSVPPEPVSGPPEPVSGPPEPVSGP